MADCTIDLAAFAAAPLSNDPFAHVVVAHFVPPAALEAIVAGLPDLPARGSYPPSAVRLGEAARRLVHDLEGRALRQAMATKFDLDLSGAPTMLTLRGRTTERDGKIHRDSAAKLVTVLLYLNPGHAEWAGRGGSLRLLRGPDDLEDYAVEVPPVDGTLLAFPNGPNTWHGHRLHVGRRYAIQLNYMAAGAAARSELRRHKVSALVKRLTRAA
jgi:hypothetical protein